MGTTLPSTLGYTRWATVQHRQALAVYDASVMLRKRGGGGERRKEGEGERKRG
jgi:hypothetical protein